MLRLLRRLEAGAFTLASNALSRLPRSWVFAAAHASSGWAALLVRGRMEVALQNLACTEIGRALSPRERRRLARASLGHSLALALDVLTLPRVASDPERYCEIGAESVELLQSADARGRGVLLVASHFGLMESMGIRLGQVLGARGQRLSFVAKPFPNEAPILGLRSLGVREAKQRVEVLNSASPRSEGRKRGKRAAKHPRRAARVTASKTQRGARR